MCSSNGGFEGTVDAKESRRDGDYSPEAPPYAYSPVTPSYSSGAPMPAQQDQDVPDAIMDIKLVVARELWNANSSDDWSSSSGNASDDSTDYWGFACQINEDTAEEHGLSNRSKMWLSNQQIFES